MQWGFQKRFSWGKTCVFLGLRTEAEENPRDLLSPSCCGGTSTKRILEAAMQSLDCTVHLRMISGGLMV
jgi:hypothetical protein